MIAKLRMVATILFPLLLGAVADLYWSDIHAVVGPMLPDALYYCADWIAIIAIFVAIAPISTGLCPPTNIWSRLLYLLGVMMFFASLLANDNSGNIILEVALTTTTIMSLFTVKSEPLAKDNVIWQTTYNRMTAAVVVTAMIFLVWPTSTTFEYEWWAWPWIARTGGIMLYFTIALAQRGYFNGKMHWFFAVHGVANSMLALSTIGQFNLTGLLVNVALAAMMVMALHEELSDRLEAKSAQD